jgi:hypothetical protein
VFTEEERDRIRRWLLDRVEADERVVAAAIVGSEAQGRADRWSDLDLTFGVTATVDDVLADWTAELIREFGAVHLFDLPVGSTVYRVFLFPGNLQVDLSFAPAAEFGSRGPAFKLLFGTAVEHPAGPPPDPSYLSGLAIHHLVRARICVEREQLWRAEYWLSEARDLALILACLSRGLETAHGRGYDRLPADVRSAFEPALVRSLDPAELLRALDVVARAVLREGGDELGLEGELGKLSGQLA